MSFRKRQIERRRNRNKNLQNNLSDDEQRPSLPSRGRKQRGKKTKQKDFRDSSKARNLRSAERQKSLYTNGGEFTLNGQPYVGLYHIMKDGRAMSGASHKVGFARRRNKSNEKFTNTSSVISERYFSLISFSHARAYKLIIRVNCTSEDTIII